MKTAFGNMWIAQARDSVVCVTTNSTLNKSGELVMGAGAARQAQELFPELPSKFGQFVSATCGNLGKLGCVG